MKRCTQCVLPEICPGITFDSKGICNVCHDFDQRWGNFKRETESREQQLGRIFDSYRNKSKEYDCLVPISGGFDSTYALYVCRRIYNLSALAFNFNNGFQSEIAKQNIETAVKKLEVDFVTASPPWEKASKLYALFFKKTGEFCTPCNLGIWSMSYKIAKDQSIPLIVSGSSNRISERLPRRSRTYSWSPSYFRQVIRGEVPAKDVPEYLYLPDNFHNSTLRRISQRVLPYKNVNILPLFDYIEYDINLMLHALKVELNWRQKANTFHHIDCIMEPVNDYFRQRKWGFSAAAWYSMLARTGQISRDEALKLTLKEEEKNLQEPPELELWLKSLNLSRDDLKDFEKRSQFPYFPVQDGMRSTADRILGEITTRLGF